MVAESIRPLLYRGAKLVAMSKVTDLLFLAMPVDPARYTCGKNCSPALIEQNRKALGYDKPALVQWGDFVGGLFFGREYPADPTLRETAPNTIVHCPAPCLGYSPQSTALVSVRIGAALPVSVSLALAAFVMWIIGGVGLGITAALRKGTLVDRALVGTSLVFYAFPTFFVGLILYIYVAVVWKIVPIPQWVPPSTSVVRWLQGLFLPGLTLALFFMAGYVRLTRAFVLESLSEDYVRTARAKGLPRGQTLFKHVMRAALTPLVTIAGLDLAGLLGGAIITENVFNYPGLGKLAVESAVTYDLPMTVGIVLLLASFVIAANIIVDVLYAFIDPRVKLA
jgi:peptide/nickel transport system permease protein